MWEQFAVQFPRVPQINNNTHAQVSAVRNDNEAIKQSIGFGRDKIFGRKMTNTINVYSF